MGPRHLAQCYRCRRTFEADRRGARYCPECEREQRRRFRVLPGGKDPRYGWGVAPAARPRAARPGPRSGRWPLGWRQARRGGPVSWRSRWTWRRWHQLLRLVAVVAAAAAAQVAWEQVDAGSWPVEWLVYLAGAAWIWNRRDQAA
ncbi:hypothetical protein [Thermaerobacter subterraneus]|uniref:Uncharacterized protein n=1 Tax=Thermaerobacter subterraneus DSM 13965 TaxID=867903 RepID=K6P447_9FIRM|nr:hypothetical protein [Thermaerobacter subterraneus]EKP95830.1 hypothetical protein ThesuDRAFT_01590 [Thermaerobacter subterraneus DSM 13965]